MLVGTFVIFTLSFFIQLTPEFGDFTLAGKMISLLSEISPQCNVTQGLVWWEGRARSDHSLQTVEGPLGKQPSRVYLTTPKEEAGSRGPSEKHTRQPLSFTGRTRTVDSLPSSQHKAAVSPADRTLDHWFQGAPLYGELGKFVKMSHNKSNYDSGLQFSQKNIPLKTQLHKKIVLFM